MAKDPSDCLSPLTSAKSYFSESRYSARYFPANIPWPMTGNGNSDQISHLTEEMDKLKKKLKKSQKRGKKRSRDSSDSDSDSD